MAPQMLTSVNGRNPWRTSADQPAPALKLFLFTWLPQMSQAVDIAQAIYSILVGWDPLELEVVCELALLTILSRSSWVIHLKASW
jgi:hypothetical protein